MQNPAKNIGLAVIVSFALAVSDAGAAPVVKWISQFGTPAFDAVAGVTVDSLGNVLVGGATAGNFAAANLGLSDGFVAKFSPTGNLTWSRQYGSAGGDFTGGVSTSTLGDVYVSGSSLGSVYGANVGKTDLLLSKYDEAGSLKWGRQAGGPDFDTIDGVSTNFSGNVYVSGFTYGGVDGGVLRAESDALLRKYDASGNVLWTRLLDVAINETSIRVSADKLGDVYIAGNLNGTGRSYAFVSKYTAAGDFQWTRQVPTISDSDECAGVSADGLGNVYVGGSTFDATNGVNDQGAFLCKYDATGNLLWTKEVDSSRGDYGYSVSADGLGNVYLGGRTLGILGESSAGFFDGYVSKLDDDGNLQWTFQLGTTGSDDISSVWADATGNVVVAGTTPGSLGSPSLGGSDGWVAVIREQASGDYDIDGDVDGNDFLRWQQTLNSTNDLAADGDGSGVIDAGDLAVWRDLYGVASVSPVPEPTGLLGLSAALTPLIRPRKRWPQVSRSESRHGGRDPFDAQVC